MEVSDLNFRKYIKHWICSVSDFFVVAKKKSVAFVFTLEAGIRAKFSCWKADSKSGIDPWHVFQALGWLVVEPSHLEKYHIVKLDHFPKYRCEKKTYLKPPPSRTLHASFWNQKMTLGLLLFAGQPLEAVLKEQNHQKSSLRLILGSFTILISFYPYHPYPCNIYLHLP